MKRCRGLPRMLECTMAAAAHVLEVPWRAEALAAPCMCKLRL
jgi:hypothetical protein